MAPPLSRAMRPCGRDVGPSWPPQEQSTYSIGLRQRNSFKQSGPSGTVPAPPPDRPSEGEGWSQAQRQVKPVWKLEKKHVGTLSAGLSPRLSGVRPQPAYFFCPGTSRRSGATAALTGHCSCWYPSSLWVPSLFSNTLLYRRSSYRHRTYRHLESFCLHSSPSEKRPFPFPQKRLPVRLTANKAASFPVSAMAQPMASCPAEPYLSLGAAGESPSGKRLASAISGKMLSPLSSSYKPVLNNSSFMRPNSTKVPFSQATEGLKPVPSPKIQLVSWHHAGGTGDCALQPTEHKVPKSNGIVLRGALAHSPLPTPGSLDTPTTSVASPRHNQGNVAMRIKPRPCGLDGDSVPQVLTKEVQFTEAVRKFTASGFEKVRPGYQFEQSGSVHPSLQWGLLNRSSRWKPPVVGQQLPQEGAGADRILPGAPDSLELDSTVICTKRISIHLLASHNSGLSRSPAHGSVIDSSPLGEDKTPVLPCPPKPFGLADVATRLSSIHLGHFGKEGPKEARELDSLAKDIG